MPTYIFKNPAARPGSVRKFLLQFPGDIRAVVGYAIKAKLADENWVVMDAADSNHVPQDRPVILCKETSISTHKPEHAEPSQHDIDLPETENEEAQEVFVNDEKFEGVKTGNDDEGGIYG